ncbi:MAG: DUF4405 domain-containing protein [Pyrobaculum sp.]
MKKATLCYIIDMAMIPPGVAVAVSGLVRYFFLPSGVKKGGQAVFLGLTKDTWTTIHEWSGFILLGLAAAHVALHFNWLINMTKLFLKKKWMTCTRCR